jgi:hypothetical protein
MHLQQLCRKSTACATAENSSSNRSSTSAKYPVMFHHPGHPCTSSTRMEHRSPKSQDPPPIRQLGRAVLATCPCRYAEAMPIIRVLFTSQGSAWIALATSCSSSHWRIWDAPVRCKNLGVRLNSRSYLMVTRPHNPLVPTRRYEESAPSRSRATSVARDRRAQSRTSFRSDSILGKAAVKCVD